MSENTPTTPSSPRPPKQARTGLKSTGTRKAASKSNRSRAREFALQALYQHLVGGNSASSIDSFTRDLAGFHKADAAHYDAVLHGCITTAEELDKLIEPKLDRKLSEISPIEHATNNPRDTTLWSHTCPEQRGVQVEDYAKGSPVRIDCLRFKRRADNEEFLTKNRPALEKWAKQNKAEPLAPYSHVSYRYATAEGGYLLVEALVDMRLLRPKTVGTDQFLSAGRPAQEWLDQFVQAAKNSVAMLDGRFVVPPFPVPLPQ